MHGAQIESSSRLHQDCAQLNHAYTINFFDDDIARVQPIILSKIHHELKPSAEFNLINLQLEPH
jgi:hypothetical protein